MLSNWVTIFVKVDGIEKFKMETCCTDYIELGNKTFLKYGHHRSEAIKGLN